VLNSGHPERVDRKVPPCTRRVPRFGEFGVFGVSALVESITYAGSVGIRIPIPPAGTIPSQFFQSLALQFRGDYDVAVKGHLTIHALA